MLFFHIIERFVIKVGRTEKWVAQREKELVKATVLMDFFEYSNVFF